MSEDSNAVVQYGKDLVAPSAIRTQSLTMGRGFLLTGGALLAMKAIPMLFGNTKNVSSKAKNYIASSGFINADPEELVEEKEHQLRKARHRWKKEESKLRQEMEEARKKASDDVEDAEYEEVEEAPAWAQRLVTDISDVKESVADINERVENLEKKRFEAKQMKAEAKS